MNPSSCATVDVELLAAVLDRLLPAVDELPAAGAMGLAPAVAADAATVPELEGALDAVLVALPPNFGELEPNDRDEALRALEGSDPRAFAGVVNLAYNAYYTDRRVLERVERLTDYTARPPQPLGHELEPFDESLLEQARRREPFWRQV